MYYLLPRYKTYDLRIFNCRQRFLDFIVDLRMARIAKPAPGREARDWKFEKPERVAAPAGEARMALLQALDPLKVSRLPNHLKSARVLLGTGRIRLDYGRISAI